MRSLQPVSDCECKDVLTAVRDLGQLALKVADVGFEAVALPHHDGEKTVIVPLSLSARCVLSEKLFGHFFKVVKVGNRTNLRPHLSDWKGR